MEAYKGLYISIGGDVSKLNAALRSANSAIRETQSQLRQLEKAAKLDPGNVSTFNLKLEVMKDKAQANVEKLVKMRTTLRELANTTGLRKIAEDTESISAKAKKATEAYSAVCDKIAQIRHTVVDSRLDKIFEIKDTKGLEKAKEELREIGAEEKQVEKFAKLMTERFKGLTGIKLEKNTQQLEKLRNQIHNTSQATLEHNDNAQQAVEKLKAMGASASQCSRYMKLLDEYFDKLKANEFAKSVAEFRNLQVQVAAVEAETKALYLEMAKLAVMNPAVTMSEKFQKLRMTLGMAEEATSELKREFSTLDEALRINPASIETAKLKMKNLQEQSEANRVALKSINEQLEVMRAKGVDKVSSQFTNVKVQVQQTAAKVASLEQKLEEAKFVMDEIGKNGAAAKQTSEYKKAEKAVEKYSEELRVAQAELDELGSADAYNKLLIEQQRVVASQKEVDEAMTKTTGSTSGLRGAMQQLGWSMYSTVTPMMMMFAYKAVSSAEQIDASYRNMRKTVQGTEEEFERLKQAAIDYSRTHITSADKILEIEAMGGQLGIATEKLEAFATTCSNLEIATDLSVDQVSEQLGQLQGILSDMTEDDFSKFGDALVRLGNNSATLESHIMDVMMRIGSMGTIVGFSTPQLLGWATAVASTGQGAEAAGTAISKTMADIESAVGAGGDKLASFAQVAGVSAGEFKSSWNMDPSGTMYKFIMGLKDIEASGGSAANTLKGLGINSVRQKQAILGLMNTVDGLNDSIKMSKNAWDGVSDDWGKAGDAANEADKKSEGFSGTIQMLRNNFDDFAMEIGESFTPALQAVSEMVVGLTEAYSHLSSSQKALIDILMLALAALGPVTVAINGVKNAGEAISKWRAGDAFSTLAREAKRSKGELGATLTLMKETPGAANKAKVGMMGLSSAVRSSEAAMKALKLALRSIAVMFAMDSIISIVQTFSEYSEKAKEASEATTAFGRAYKASQQDMGASDDYMSQLPDSMDKYIERAGNVLSSTKDMANGIADNFAKIGTESATLRKCTEDISELSAKQSLNAIEQEKLKVALETYNKIAGTNYSVIDATTGKLSVSTEELRKNTDSWEANAKAVANQQAAQEAYKKSAEAAAEYEVAQDKLAETSRGFGLWIGDFPLFADPTSEAYHDLETKANELKAAQDDAAAAADKFTQQVGEEAEGLNATGDAADEATDSVGELSDEMQEMRDELDELMESSTALSGMLDASGMSVEQLAQKMSDAGISVADLKKGLEDFSKKAQDAFGQIETKSDITLDQMLENLQHNAEVTRNWGTNIQQLYVKAGKGSKKEFVKYIAEMGVEYAPIVEALLNDTTGKLDELAAAYESGGAAGMNAYLASIGILPGETAAVMDSAVQSVTDGTQRTTSAIDSEAPNTQGAMANLVEGVDYEASQLAANLPDNAAEAANEFIQEIDNCAPEAAAAADRLSKLVADHLSASTIDAWYAGRAMSLDSFKPGIEFGRDGASAAARALSKLVADHFSSANGDAWWAGKNMAEGMAQGIRDGSSAAVEAARQMARDAVNASKKEAQINSPSKVMAKVGDGYPEGMALGIERSTQIATLAAAASARAAIKSAQEVMGGTTHSGLAMEFAAANSASSTMNVNVTVDSSDMAPAIASAVGQSIAYALPNGGDYKVVLDGREVGRFVRKAVA